MSFGGRCHALAGNYHMEANLYVLALPPGEDRRAAASDHGTVFCQKPLEGNGLMTCKYVWGGALIHESNGGLS